MALPLRFTPRTAFHEDWQAQCACPDSSCCPTFSRASLLGLLICTVRMWCQLHERVLSPPREWGPAPLARADSSAQEARSHPLCFSQSSQTPQGRCSQLLPAPWGPPLGRSWLLLVQPPPPSCQILQQRAPKSYCSVIQTQDSCCVFSLLFFVKVPFALPANSI